MVRVGHMTYLQDHKWYDNLVDGCLKKETLMYKAQIKGSLGDATPDVMKFCAWLKNSFENFHKLDYDVLVKLEECWWKVNTNKVCPFTRWDNRLRGPYANAKSKRTFDPFLNIDRKPEWNYETNNGGNIQDGQRCMENLTHEPSACKIRRFLPNSDRSRRSRKNSVHSPRNCCYRKDARLDVQRSPLNLSKINMMPNHDSSMGLLLQGSTIEIKDKKGAENLAADHLSRLENPNMGILTKKEIANEFPDKHLMVLKATPKDNEPWLFPDNTMRICVAGNKIPKILAHCHSGPTGGHHSDSITKRKVYESGFFGQVSSETPKTTLQSAMHFKKSETYHHERDATKLQYSLLRS
ncbi:hypothetical protein Tco_0400901 [Tanacetum coccineum]